MPVRNANLSLLAAGVDDNFLGFPLCQTFSIDSLTRGPQPKFAVIIANTQQAATKSFRLASFHATYTSDLLISNILMNIIHWH